MVAAPAKSTFEKINTAAQQLECATDTIYSIYSKHESEDLLSSIYLPILDHSNNIYQCENEQ